MDKKEQPATTKSTTKKPLKKPLYKIGDLEVVADFQCETCMPEAGP